MKNAKNANAKMSINVFMYLYTTPKTNELKSKNSASKATK